MEIYIKLIFILLLMGFCKFECKLYRKYININKTETTSEVMENRVTWSYNNSVPNGQLYWSLTYGECNGKNQSPINIDLNTTVYKKFTKNSKLQINGYELKATSVNITNDGHTVSIELNYENKTIPTIHSGPLKEDNYEFVQLHFHWGENLLYGSEHSINNKKYPMEVHLIHYNRKYNSFNEAATKPDGLVVIGLFYNIKNSAPIYEFIEYFPHIMKPGTKLYLTTINNKEMYSIKDLIGDTSITNYVMYKGSLTTPPCYESVTWLLNLTPTKIKLKQYLQFQKLLNSHGVSMGNNYRVLQQHNERKVSICK